LGIEKKPSTSGAEKAEKGGRGFKGNAECWNVRVKGGVKYKTTLKEKGGAAGEDNTG